MKKDNDPWLDRKSAAQLVSAEYFVTSKRATERWPLPGILLRGRVHYRESDVRRFAQGMIAASPAVGPPRSDR